MKLSSFKRIITEDAKEEYRELVSQLAYSINPFAEEVLQAFNNNLTIQDNFNQTFKDIFAEVDASGTPTATLQFKTDLKGNCIGHDVIKADSLTNPITYVNGKPFLTFTEINGVLTVNNITGLPANKKFKLKVLLFS